MLALRSRLIWDKGFPPSLSITRLIVLALAPNNDKRSDRIHRTSNWTTILNTATMPSANPYFS